VKRSPEFLERQQPTEILHAAHVASRNFILDRRALPRKELQQRLGHKLTLLWPPRNLDCSGATELMNSPRCDPNAARIVRIDDTTLWRKGHFARAGSGSRSRLKRIYDLSACVDLLRCTAERGRSHPFRFTPIRKPETATAGAQQEYSRPVCRYGDGPHTRVAKTSSFLLPGFCCRGSSFHKLKDFAPPFSEMQSSRVVPLASAPAGCATLHSTTGDHCDLLRICFEFLNCSSARGCGKWRHFASRNRSIPKLARPVRRESRSTHFTR
jgi:hypothetical protein